MQRNDFITSDTHFGHANIVRKDFSNRPFPKRPDDIAVLEDRVAAKKATNDEEQRLKRWLKAHVHLMDEELIRRWNAKVPHDAIVYHLGDFGFSDKHRLAEIIRRLNGRIRIFPGNHDKVLLKEKSLQELFEWFRPFSFNESKSDDGRMIVMCHYAMAVWNKSHHGAWMLHGHSHGSLPTEGRVRMDVGVDCHPNYEPFSYAEIERVLSKLQPGAFDHHGKRGRTFIPKGP